MNPLQSGVPYTTRVYVEIEEALFWTTLLIPYYEEAGGIPRLCQHLHPLIRYLGMESDVRVLFDGDESKAALTNSQVRRDRSGSN